jgi:general secretion pathway protein H
MDKVFQPGRSRTISGVTLMELLVVAALAAVLLAIVFPSIRAGMGTLELRSSAQKIAAAAKFARDQAVYRQAPVELEIDSEHKTVSLIDSNGQTRSFELPAGVIVAKVLPASDQGGPKRTFLFSPDGSSMGFGVILANAHRSMRVTTDALTGFPKIAEVPTAETPR